MRCSNRGVPAQLRGGQRLGTLALAWLFTWASRERSWLGRALGARRSGGLDFHPGPWTPTLLDGKDSRDCLGRPLPSLAPHPAVPGQAPGPACPDLLCHSTLVWECPFSG